MSEPISNEKYLQLQSARDAAWDKYYTSHFAVDLAAATQLDRDFNQARDEKVWGYPAGRNVECNHE